LCRALPEPRESSAPAATTINPRGRRPAGPRYRFNSRSSGEASYVMGSGRAGRPV
jgi:hypothetical protein